MNPFIDPEGYRRFLAGAEQRFREQLASEQVVLKRIVPAP